MLAAVVPESDRNCQWAPTICYLNGSFPTDAESDCAAVAAVATAAVLACDSDSVSGLRNAAAGAETMKIYPVVTRSYYDDGPDYGSF